MHAIISIHDVMPHTLDKVAGIIESMPRHCAQRLTLLIVTGLDWKQPHLDVLQDWQRRGLILAGHGWTHRIKRTRGLYHRLHSRILSRDAAEHLSMTEEEIARLLRLTHDWFADHGLRPPELYVPPAWAMGAAGRPVLREAPYRYFETTSGFYDSATDRCIRLPLAGFEADTVTRYYALKFWNVINKSVASSRRPLRISIHPDDPSLRLAEEMAALLRRVDTPLAYDSL